MKFRFTCCICGNEALGYGNNPWPISKYPGVCCSPCNTDVVIPARAKRYYGQGEVIRLDLGQD